MLEILKLDDPDRFCPGSFHSFKFYPGTFAEEVEYYAPGYLSLEAQGRAAEYDAITLIDRTFGEPR